MLFRFVLQIRYQGRSRDEYATLVSQLEQQLAKTRKLQEQTHSKLIEEKRLRNNADGNPALLKQILINIAILNDFRMFSFSLIRTLQILETKWRETESDH